MRTNYILTFAPDATELLLLYRLQETQAEAGSAFELRASKGAEVLHVKANVLVGSWDLALDTDTGDTGVRVMLTQQGDHAYTAA